MVLYHGTRLKSVKQAEDILNNGMWPIGLNAIVEKVVSYYKPAFGGKTALLKKLGPIIRNWEKRDGVISLARKWETAEYYAKNGSAIEVLLRQRAREALFLQVDRCNTAIEIGKVGAIFYCYLDNRSPYLEGPDVQVPYLPAHKITNFKVVDSGDWEKVSALDSPYLDG